MNKLPGRRREKLAIFVTKPGVDSSSIGGTLYRVKANHQSVRDAVMLGRVVPIVCRNAPRIAV